MIGSWQPRFSAWSRVSWKLTPLESWSSQCCPARLGGREQDVLQMHWSLFCCSRLLGVVRIYENQKIRFLPNILLFHLELHINCTHLCTLWKAHCEVLLLLTTLAHGHCTVDKDIHIKYTSVKDIFIEIFSFIILVNWSRDIHREKCSHKRCHQHLT